MNGGQFSYLQLFQYFNVCTTARACVFVCGTWDKHRTKRVFFGRRDTSDGGFILLNYWDELIVK